MKKYFLLLLLAVNVLWGQKTIHQYKYVMVPSKFAFLDQNDQYRLNTLTKLLLEKYGFKAYLDNEELPAGLLDSGCEKLYADVISSGNFIRTKLQVVLKDCKKKVVYQTEIGTSKEKEYKTAYTQALRAAFTSFDDLQYHDAPVPEQAVAETKDLSNQSVVVLSETFDTALPVYYAQAIPGGYQLVDTTPKVVMKMYKTSDSKVFTAVKGDIQGVLLLKENQWFFEYYQSDRPVSEKVNIKF